MVLSAASIGRSVTSGSISVTVVPLPTALSTWTDPPFASANHRTMLSPKPVPPRSRFVEKNGSNIRPSGFQREYRSRYP